MRKKFTEEQIVRIVQRSKNGESAKDLAREIGASPATIFLWRKKYRDMMLGKKLNGGAKTTMRIDHIRRSV